MLVVHVRLHESPGTVVKSDHQPATPRVTNASTQLKTCVTIHSIRADDQVVLGDAGPPRALPHCLEACHAVDPAAYRAAAKRDKGHLIVVALSTCANIT